MTNRIVFGIIDNIRFQMRRFLNSRNAEKRFDKHSYIATEIDNLSQRIRAMEETIVIPDVAKGVEDAE